jgi:hypothetical protein
MIVNCFISRPFFNFETIGLRWNNLNVCTKLYIAKNTYKYYNYFKTIHENCLIYNNPIVLSPWCLSYNLKRQHNSKINFSTMCLIILGVNMVLDIPFMQV